MCNRGRGWRNATKNQPAYMTKRTLAALERVLAIAGPHVGRDDVDDFERASYYVQLSRKFRDNPPPREVRAMNIERGVDDDAREGAVH